MTTMNMIFFCSLNTAFFLSFTFLIINSDILHFLFYSIPLEMNKNFRVIEETRMSSPTTFENESTVFTLPPNKMQGSISTAEWTDKKHSMYLKSMEASFVNRLYDSKEMLGCFSRIKTSSDLTTTSGQFKVLRGGCWQKISFERENPQMSRLNECHDLKENPWIQHYRSSSKQGNVAAPVLEESATSSSQVVDLGQRKRISSVSATGSGQLHLCESHTFHQDLVCSDTEMSDQNFADEEVEGEKENKRKVKRLKSLIIDARGNDQIVPIRKSSTTGDVTKNCVSAD